MKLLVKSIVLVAVTLLLASANAFATDRALPAELIIAAIQIAVIDQPGLVREVEVEKRQGRLIVVVEMVGVDGRRSKVRIEPERYTRVR